MIGLNKIYVTSKPQPVVCFIFAFGVKIVAAADIRMAATVKGGHEW